MRMIVVICFLIIFLEALSILMLLPSYIVVNVERDLMARGTDQIKKSISGKGSIESELKEVGEQVHAFVEYETARKSSVSEIIKNILSLRPNGITSSSISIIQDGENGVVQLGGVGVSREALIEFQRIVSMQEYVKDSHYQEKFIMQKSNINYNLIISLE